jgi:hypothetical protein
MVSRPSQCEMTRGPKLLWRALAGVAAFVACTLLSCASSEDEADTARKRCTALRDHLVEMRVEDAAEAVDVKAHTEAMRQALGDDFIDSCTKRPVNEIRCALSAQDSSSVAECSASN